MKIATFAALFAAVIATAAVIAEPPGSLPHRTRDAAKSLLIASLNADGTQGIVVAPLGEVGELKLRGPEIVSVQLIAGPGVDASGGSCQPIWFFNNGSSITGSKFVPDYAGSLVNVRDDAGSSSDQPKAVKAVLQCEFS